MSPPPPGRSPEDEGGAHRHHDGAGGEGGDEDEAGQEGAEDGAGGADGRVRPHHRPGVVEARQTQLHHHGRDRRQHRRREEEAEGGEQEDGEGTSAGQQGADRVDQQRRRQRRHSTADEQRSQEPGRISPVGGAAACPRPGGDPGEDDADDPGHHLQAHPQVRSHEPLGQDLQHEDGGRGEEDQEAGAGGGHAGSIAHRPVQREREKYPAPRLAFWAGGDSVRNGSGFVRFSTPPSGLRVTGRSSFAVVISGVGHPQGAAQASWLKAAASSGESRRMA